jgi:hypothetical protein
MSDVNLAATVPGWNRWSAAEAMLKRIQPKDDGRWPVTIGTILKCFLINRPSTKRDSWPIT